MKSNWIAGIMATLGLLLLTIAGYLIFGRKAVGPKGMTREEILEKAREQKAAYAKEPKEERSTQSQFENEEPVITV